MKPFGADSSARFAWRVVARDLTARVAKQLTNRLVIGGIAPEALTKQDAYLAVCLYASVTLRFGPRDRVMQSAKNQLGRHEPEGL